MNEEKEVKLTLKQARGLMLAVIGLLIPTVHKQT